MLERLYAIKRPFDFQVSLQRHRWPGNNIIFMFSRFRWSRVIVICWGFAFLPAIPLIFNSTIEKTWENNSNCKCFYPLDDVSIWDQQDPELRPNFSRKFGCSGLVWQIFWFLLCWSSSSGRWWRTISLSTHRCASAAGPDSVLCFNLNPPDHILSQESEKCDNQDGFHHRPLPRHHLPFLLRLCQRRLHHPGVDQVARLDLLLPSPQRYVPALRLHPLLWETEGGLFQSDLLWEKQGGKTNCDGAFHLPSLSCVVSKLCAHGQHERGLHPKTQKCSEGKRSGDSRLSKMFSCEPGHHTFWWWKWNPWDCEHI